MSNVYQFKITLKGPKPKRWRRIQVPENYNFDELHMAIQRAMGWRNVHLHKFDVKNPQTQENDTISMEWNGRCDYQDDIPEKRARIADYFVNPNDKAMYEYDLGMGWDHEVVLEEILPAVCGSQYPKCLAGKMACPPEDGVRPRDYDPKVFDPKQVIFTDAN